MLPITAAWSCFIKVNSNLGTREKLHPWFQDDSYNLNDSYLQMCFVVSIWAKRCKCADKCTGKLSGGVPEINWNVLAAILLSRHYENPVKSLRASTPSSAHIIDCNLSNWFLNVLTNVASNRVIGLRLGWVCNWVQVQSKMNSFCSSSVTTHERIHGLVGVPYGSLGEAIMSCDGFVFVIFTLSLA